MKNLIALLLSFSEENWCAFVAHCEERGIDEKEIEELLEIYKREGKVV